MFCETMLANEVRVFWAVCQELEAGLASADADEIRLALEDLDAMSMHSDRGEIRRRALAAIDRGCARALASGIHVTLAA